jgi:hypothetical protein
MLCWKQAKAKRKTIFGTKGMHEKSDSWKEEDHVHMHGRLNNAKVRFFVIQCNGLLARNV